MAKTANSRRAKPYNEFKGWLRANGKTYKDLGSLLNVRASSTIVRMINGPMDFQVYQLRLLNQAWNVPYEIFLSEKS